MVSRNTTRVEFETSKCPKSLRELPVIILKVEGIVISIFDVSTKLNDGSKEGVISQVGPEDGWLEGSELRERDGRVVNEGSNEGEPLKYGLREGRKLGTLADEGDLEASEVGKSDGDELG